MDVPLDVDLYGLIGAEQTASVHEIKKAYRKKALSCHPDKNPDNPKAAELFHELSRALEILTDSSARAAYDKVLDARRQAKERVREYDAKRKKLKEDLEAREQAYANSVGSRTGCVPRSDEDRLRAEVERLRKEGSKQVEEEVARVRRQIIEELRGSRSESNVPGCYRVKIKWKTSESGESEYDYDTLHRILSKYGDIVGLASRTNKGRALVEFRNKSEAEMAVKTEIGFLQNPLTLRKMWDTERGEATTRTKLGFDSRRESDSRPGEPSGIGKHVNQGVMSDAEFERSVLRNLKEAEERKRSLGGTNAKGDA